MIPAKIGKYTVIELLGQGGMGEVYLGEDPYIGRRVAIKTIKGADPTARDRFLHEARVIGGLTHPAIVSLIDFDFSGDEPFLVMELLKGKGLDAWIREPHTLHEKLVIVEDLCQALAFAHENGVLHRDVKPSNVQVLASGRAKLMDFGIARGSAARLTATGAVMGTPEYMAPEILRDASYSAHSDVYACAVLLYEMFTGENPFAGKTVAATLTNVLTASPPDLRSVRPEVPQRLAAVVMACLRKEPDARPSGFGELIAACREAQASPLADLPETRAIPISGAVSVTAAKVALAGSGAGGGRRWLLVPLAIAALVVAWFALRPSSAPVSEPGAQQTLSLPTPMPSPGTAEVAPTQEATPKPEPALPLATRLPEIKAAGAARAARLPDPSTTRRPAEDLPADVATGRPEVAVVATPAVTPPTTSAWAGSEAQAQATPARAEPLPTARPAMTPLALPAIAAPTVSSVSPRSVRRGTSVVLEVRGEGLRPDMTARILQGRRNAAGIRVLRVEFVSPLLLRVTLLSEAELPLGGYTLLLQDASGASIPGLQIEVVL